jgi:hypothetical protein
LVSRTYLDLSAADLDLDKPLRRRPVSASSACRGFRLLRIPNMVEKDPTGPLLTDGAGGFLPSVPLGCLGMWDQDHG